MNISKAFKVAAAAFALCLVSGSPGAAWVQDRPFAEKARASDVVLVGHILKSDVEVSKGSSWRGATFRIGAVFQDRKASKKLQVGDEGLFLYSIGSLELDDSTCCEPGKDYLLFLKRTRGRADVYIYANGPYSAYLLDASR